MHQLSILLVLAVTACAAPFKRASAITAADIINIYPGTATCGDADPNFPQECRTAAEAASYIAVSFLNFGLDSFGEQAAVLALMLYESGGFVYSASHFPTPVIGKGTRNMQSPEYNVEYAQWLAACSVCQVSASAVSQVNADPAGTLALVNNDQWGFGSAAWFLSTQCDASVRQELQQGTLQGWTSYVQDCVGTPVTADRTALWTKAMALQAW